VEETKGPLDVENLINAVQNVAAVVCSQLQQQDIGCSKGLSPFDVRFNPSILSSFFMTTRHHYKHNTSCCDK